MKKILLFVMLLVSAVSLAQLKKVETVKATEVGKAQQFGGPLEADCTKLGNVYTIRFRDAKFTTIDQYRSFSFEDVENTFADLYATIEKGFEDMPKEPIMLELPNHYIWLDFHKFLGSKVLSISCTESKTKDSQVYISNEIAKKQVEKLFGKK